MKTQGGLGKVLLRIRGHVEQGVCHQAQKLTADQLT